MLGNIIHSTDTFLSTFRTSESQSDFCNEWKHNKKMKYLLFTCFIYVLHNGTNTPEVGSVIVTRLFCVSLFLRVNTVRATCTLNETHFYLKLFRDHEIQIKNDGFIYFNEKLEIVLPFMEEFSLNTSILWWNCNRFTAH